MMQGTLKPVPVEDIKSFLSSENVKVEWFASEVGVCRSTVNRWCNGDIKSMNSNHLLKVRSVIARELQLGRSWPEVMVKVR